MLKGPEGTPARIAFFDENSQKFDGSFVTLEQFVQPANVMPGVMKKIVPKIGQKKVRHMVEDLFIVQKRISCGECLEQILESGLKHQRQGGVHDDDCEEIFTE
eukprot:TRINITY_DN66879_c0_g1_i1.p5 TRINITY_DN66879_c0_g1~~TRINITY_DN66879_c0_g1_i1.p5  ORF type:complete len:103 (+),score=16.18 TRINITY_DN66879_c0_g1_i1:654-962(+)